MPKPTEYQLICHLSGASHAVRSFGAAARFDASGQLLLSYRLEGLPDAISIPQAARPEATDGLWQHTCCEAFVAASGEDGYREFNFSPSGQWAAYSFNAYRERDSGFVAASPPHITFTRAAAGFRLDVTLAPALLPAGEVFDFGLTAVIEAVDGNKTYWALRHCAAQPDFHLRQSFVLALPRSTT